MSQMEMGEVAVAGQAVALAHWHAVRLLFAFVWTTSSLNSHISLEICIQRRVIIQLQRMLILAAG